jgi:hypothetical protein
MARTTVCLAALLALAFMAPGATGAARTDAHLHGGGTASISQVAFNISIAPSGAASGSFECLMAGRSAFVLGAFGLVHNMIVHATPTTGSMAGSKVTFTGAGSLTLDGHVKMSVHVDVWVDTATQTFQLTVVEVGSMPVETFTSGGVALN